MDEFDTAVKKKSKVKKKKKDDEEEELTLESLEASLKKKKNKKKETDEQEEGFTFNPSSTVNADVDKKKKKKKKEEEEVEEGFSFETASIVITDSTKADVKKKKKKEIQEDEEEFEVITDAKKKKKEKEKKEPEEFSFKPSKVVPTEEELPTIEKKKKKKKIEEEDEKMNVEEEIIEVVEKKRKEEVVIVETSEEEEEVEFEEVEFSFEPPVKPERVAVKYDETVTKLFPKKDWVFIPNRLWDSTQRFFQIEYLDTELEIKSAPNSPQPNPNNISQNSFSSEGTTTSPRVTSTNSIDDKFSPRNFVENPDEEGGEESTKKKKKSKIISAGVGKDFFDLERKHHKDKKKILKKGELLKKSAITGIWTKKFFVLRADKLMFFASEKVWKGGIKSEGSIFLEGCAIEENTTNLKLKEKRPYCFIIYSRGISYYLECNSESSMREWIEILIQCSSVRFS